MNTEMIRSITLKRDQSLRFHHSVCIFNVMIDDGENVRGNKSEIFRNAWLFSVKYTKKVFVYSQK